MKVARLTPLEPESGTPLLRAKPKRRSACTVSESSAINEDLTGSLLQGVLGTSPEDMAELPGEVQLVTDTPIINEHQVDTHLQTVTGTSPKDRAGQSAIDRPLNCWKGEELIDHDYNVSCATGSRTHSPTGGLHGRTQSPATEYVVSGDLPPFFNTFILPKVTLLAWPQLRRGSVMGTGATLGFVSLERPHLFTLEGRALELIFLINKAIRSLNVLPQDFFWTSLQINVNSISGEHSDELNNGSSLLLGMGFFSGGELRIEQRIEEVANKLHLFDGSRTHSTSSFFRRESHGDSIRP